MTRLTRVKGMFAAATFAVAAGCTVTIQPNIFTAEEDFELSQPLENIGLMFIAWENGGIEVRTDLEATEITITGTKRVIAESAAAAADALDEWQIELAISDSDPAEAFLAFDAPPGTERMYQADLEVVLPAALDLTVENDNGSVDVEGNAETTTVRVANGSVTVNEQQGDTTVTVENGTIGIESDGGNVEAETENGNITIDAQPGENGVVEVRVDVGSIEICVPAEFAADLELDTDVGWVVADLSDFTVTHLQTSLRRVTGTLNGGGGEITARTDIGSVFFDSLR